MVLTTRIAFMLPMASGPMLVVYSTKRVSMHSMARNGLFASLAAILIGGVYMFTLLPVLLGDTGSDGPVESP